MCDVFQGEEDDDEGRRVAVVGAAVAGATSRVRQPHQGLRRHRRRSGLLPANDHARPHQDPQGRVLKPPGPAQVLLRAPASSPDRVDVQTRREQALLEGSRFRKPRVASLLVHQEHGAAG